MVNVLLSDWSGPHGGTPPFAQVKLEAWRPALELSMAEKRREIAAIADSSAPANFENTIAALEDSGRRFSALMSLYSVWGSNMSSPEFQAIEREFAPILAAFDDELVLNPKLFQRIEAVYSGLGTSGLGTSGLGTSGLGTSGLGTSGLGTSGLGTSGLGTSGLSAEQARLTWRYYTHAVRAGAKLDPQAKTRMSAINQRLAELYTSFSQNILADEEATLILEQEADLAGLPESFRTGAAAAAAQHGAAGKWAVTNTRSSVEPFLAYASREDLRQRVWERFVNRGDNGDAHDNNKIISEILKLRSERAKLLGFQTHAHWRLEDSMAKTPERALTLMEAVWKPAVARVHEEVAEMQRLAQKEGQARKIAPWDYRYYAEKVRKAKYAFDENDVKPYLQLEKLREGMFWVAGELFGFAFTPLTDVEVFHPDVRVWEVTEKATSQRLGLWYFDPYARQGKQSGAWMAAYRSQERFKTPVTTIVSNNANFVPGKPGEPLLISLEDARTLFHEFGHALHGLSSNVNYPTLSGTNVARDYVEFPSQLLEHWLTTPEVLSRFALHFETGEPIPEALIAKLRKAATFNQGFATIEYLASALIDMKLHLAKTSEIDPDAFERETLAALGMPKEIVMRHRTPQFGHVFAGDGYSAGYYSYLWADTLTADAYEAFVEAGGPYDRAVADRLLKHVFSVGDTVDPALGYLAFRGKEAGVEALMRKRGFSKAAATGSSHIKHD